MRHHSLSVLGLLMVVGCSRASPPVPPVVPDPMAALPPVLITPPAKIYVESLLDSLSVREKVGQLVVPWRLGNYAAYDSEEYDTLAFWVDSLEVGGLIISIGPPLEIAAKLNALQQRSGLPLLVAADLEWGSAMRLRGGTAFPMPMAVAATARTWDAYEVGRVTAQEARAVGIHMTYSPVADLNNNPDNPIINTRSFGEDPEHASALIGAYIRGAHDHGLLTTAKHFPGHGDTDIDSHIELPIVPACWDRLSAVELEPFRAAINAGVTAVMTAHVAVPCVTADSTEPATLSPVVMTSVLRDSLRFEGIVVTDALTMGAIVARFGVGESAVQAFLAGSDLLLFPADPREAIDAMVAAVDSGRISMERLDRSVRRMLELKRQAGLFRSRLVALDSVPTVVGRRDFRALADDMAERSLTLVQPGPIETFRHQPAPVAVISYARENNLSIGNTLVAELRRLGTAVSSFRLFPASGTLSYDSARAVIDRHRRVLFATSVRVVSGLGHLDMPDSLAALILETNTSKPSLLVSFGSPYLLSQLPGFSGGFLLAWSNTRSAERAVARAVAGGAAVGGRLPITLSAEHPRGHGVSLPAVIPEQDSLVSDMPVDTAWDRERLDAVTRFLEAKVAEGAFPGGVLLVGDRGRVVFEEAVGVYGEDDPRPVTPSTVYDLASVTKVVGLTTAVMVLVADGLLDIDLPAREYVPEFSGPAKDDVRVTHLLTHTSGLPAWVPLHLEAKTREDALRRVLGSPLETAPGSDYVYSDLGTILLTQIVERVAGERLDHFLDRRVFGPLGMRHTRFRPPETWRSFIAPTERDPGRGRVLRGEVHDENAFRLDGVSGHAGLFSTSRDLSVFARWLLDAYHDRLPPDAPVRVPASVVRRFTRRQPGPSGSTRALGWDTPSDIGSSAGTLLSAASFGHTGFTGTSIWIDPAEEVFIILLTNRVHPTRDNRALLRLRGAIADSVMGAKR